MCVPCYPSEISWTVSAPTAKSLEAAVWQSGPAGLRRIALQYGASGEHCTKFKRINSFKFSASDLYFLLKLLEEQLFLFAKFLNAMHSLLCVQEFRLLDRTAFLKRKAI